MEYISGISMHDRLIPVLTTVIYFGESPWSGPKDLHGILNLSSDLAHLKERIPNYTIDILDVRRYPYWENFKSDLRQVFGYLQHLQSGDNITKYIKEHAREYENISEDTFDVLSSVTNAEELCKIKYKHQTNNGGVNMCKAIQELIDNGIIKGRNEGRTEGKTENTIHIIRKKLEQGLSVDSISYWLDIDKKYVSEVENLHKKHKNSSDEDIRKILHL